MTIKNVRKICSMTKELTGFSFGTMYIQVDLDMTTGELIGSELMNGSYVRFDNENIIHIANIKQPAKMKDIHKLVELKIMDSGVI